MEKIELKFFLLEMCPYCIKANKYLDELLQDEKYAGIEIRKIDERKERQIANAHNYYLVPTFYLNDQKLYEGIMSKEDVRAVLDQALSLQNKKQ